MRKILLSIAGYDPTAGAGVLLDLKIFQHLGFHGMGILTALTAQNTKGVKEVIYLASDFLWQQYETLNEEILFSGIKIGMVGSRENIKSIERILSENPSVPKVIDPIFKSTSGTRLLEKEGIADLISSISGKASLITPNLDEAEKIVNFKIKHIKGMKEAAKRIYSICRIPCLIKGGHFNEEITDLLFDGEIFLLFKKDKITKNVHGTGCFLSSALLGFLAEGDSLIDACNSATRLTHDAIKKTGSPGSGQEIFQFPL